MTASCTFDEMWSGDAVLEGEEVVMTFAPSFQDFESVTKTIGDASQVDQLLVHVYEEGSNDAPMEHIYHVVNAEVTRQVSIPFFFGKKYEVFFFAYKSGDKSGDESPYTISETGLKGGITVAYPTGSLNYDALEAMDAFYAVKSVDLSQQVESNVALKRPFAQVNLAADKGHLEAAKVAKVEIRVSASTSYDFMNGPSNEKDLTFIFESNDYFANAETLGTTYLFVPSDNAEINATITLYAEGDIELKELSVGIPLELNKRTNLVFSEIEPAGPEGIKISTPEQLEAFLLGGAEEESIAVIAADIDMTGKSLSPVAFKSLELNGNNKTISGLTFSLFDEVTNLKVNNLTIADAAIKGNSHVGALVNTLKGAGTFTNVKVTDSSVSTTGGAAGGIVGYISKSTEKSREEECSVVFDGCEVNGVTVTGSASEGKFVGLLCGYDNKETVDFIGCSARNVTVADYASVYTSSNQSAWLESLDSKYDGWLGHETYRRGVVKFDGTRLVPRWDGTTVTAKADLLLYNNEANKYEVYSPFDLAGVRNVTASPAALYLMENVDMFGQGEDGSYNVHLAFTSLELDGNNKTISGLSFSLFNEASDLTVSNLTIAQANITGKSHVGALVNTLKGAATLTNVKVVSTSVSTTNGAAGGIVGYISKSTEKSREEECSVLFVGCEVNGVTVTGSASEGKFVGLLCGYDNKETVEFTKCTAAEVKVADYASVYTSSNQSAWLEPLNSKYDGWLGHETYRRGVVKFDGKRLVPRWDGTTVTAKADLLLYNGEANKYEVYSPFDLAGVRNVTASPAALYLMENVDMFGQGEDGSYNVHSNFEKSAYTSLDDKYFTAFSSIALLEGNNNYIYNLSLNFKGSDRYAFILSGDNNHIHQNINFHSCCTVVPHVVGTDNGQTVDKSYGATVVLSVGGATYTMRNVHAYDCKVFALQKTGILAGRLVSTTKSTIDNCSVNNCYIENYKCEEHKELFEESIVSAEFYSYGEIGPITGFINFNATITNCSVNNTTIKAYGQSDQKGNIANIIKAGTIPGRHVNQFIGDIRSKKGYTVSISNCSVSSNKYDQDSHSHSKGTSIPIIGEAYCLGAKIFILGQMGDEKGTVKVKNINIDGSNKFTSETSVTLQELM